jgi:hypothetical protein
MSAERTGGPDSQDDAQEPTLRTSLVDPKKLVADGYDRLCRSYADWGRVGEDGVRHH